MITAQYEHLPKENVDWQLEAYFRDSIRLFADNRKAFKKAWGRQAYTVMHAKRNWVWIHKLPEGHLFVYSAPVHGTHYEICGPINRKNLASTVDLLNEVDFPSFTSENTHSNETTWTCEWPDKEGTYWMHGWRWKREEQEGKPPETLLVRMYLGNNSIFRICEGNFLYKSETGVVRFTKAVIPSP